MIVFRTVHFQKFGQNPSGFFPFSLQNIGITRNFLFHKILSFQDNMCISAILSFGGKLVLKDRLGKTLP